MEAVVVRLALKEMGVLLGRSGKCRVSEESGDVDVVGLGWGLVVVGQISLSLRGNKPETKAGPPTTPLPPDDCTHARRRGIRYEAPFKMPSREGMKGVLEGNKIKCE